MRILIMVLSSEKPPYNALMKAQQETWDSIEVEGVQTVYYYASSLQEAALKYNITYLTDSSDEVCFPTSDEYNMMHWKFKLALAFIQDARYDYDFIFRTNSSSYVDKEALLKFAKTLPKEKCYCGINGGTYASGAGFFISRDCAEILAYEIDEHPHGAEDILIGSILSEFGITITPGAIRCDMDNLQSEIKDTYHYRCKVNRNGERIDDEIMMKIFEYKNKKP